MAKDVKERQLPNSQEAEEGCIGCILHEPTDSMLRLLQMFPGSEVFHNPRLRKLYEILCVMHDGREAIDVITLHQQLKDQNQLQAIGGLTYLSGLPDTVPSAANLNHYADIVLAKYRLRVMIEGCTDIVTRCYEDEDKATAELEDFHKDLSKMCLMAGREVDWTVTEATRNAIKDIERDLQAPGALLGLSTGFRDLDRKTRGLQNGDLIVIAARPSMGKSSIVMNIADHLAVNLRHGVGVFSLEQSKKMVMRRMISARSKVNLFTLGEDLLGAHDKALLTKAAGQLIMAPIYIDDTRGMTDIQVYSGLRRMVHEHGIKLGIIDYLQLLHTRRRFEKRNDEIGSITDGLKTLAGELNIPIVLCAQLNRENERERSQVPRISHLRESGNIEQDADLVWLLYRKGNDEDEPTGDKINAAVKIGKQRNGPTCTVAMTFHRAIFRFDRPGIDDADVPTTTAGLPYKD